MKLPPPCDEDRGLLTVRTVPDDDTPRALRHYERAIEALANATYDGLSPPERRRLLAALCRDKQQLTDT
jgi:hypothetical protein